MAQMNRGRKDEVNSLIKVKGLSKRRVTGEVKSLSSMKLGGHQVENCFGRLCPPQDLENVDKGYLGRSVSEL